MKQQPDKIFHEKLNDFNMSVPPLAWEGIETGLDKRKKGFPWLSMAASVAAVAVTVTVVLLSGEESEKISLKTSGKVTPAVEVDSATLYKVERPVSKIESTEKKALQPNVPKEPSKRNELNKVIDTNDKEKPFEAELAKVEVVIPDSIPSSYGEPVQLAFRSAQKKDNITIVLSAEDTEGYLLVKNTATTEATSDDKKASTLRKLLKKAADLKVNQDPFGELRQKKNEILALNFRSEKQRGQKK